MDEKDKLDENDFLTLRARPFYKIKDGVYRIIFNLFVVEKLFKGIYFQLRIVNKQLPEKQQLNDDELRRLYCYDFSEKILLYKILEIIYPTKCIKLSGQQLSDMKIDGAPDYYIRKGKNILLFESKNFLIKAAKKTSFDYSVYKEEFAKNLYHEELPNGKRKLGAVMQLINSIRRLLKNEFPPDKSYHYRDVFIYPILVTHDHQINSILFIY